ncbi:hypothetical protein CEUSTIGMA_g8596.t1 [Chlamydomonas eustigma]|uniref:Serpin domain-containing protein n=1 Tax=Chlamydomonas eustigma TaxID=1157962 RepID=A0A250XDJ6_9CHLO|nr:hypothetical protein CEUSTIGMA_g8596.t1 [Chlamydomonas eustigma]|eukprot:GAX81163.1 hypothetical protein CEUSTIGMA_g8596.t1 [Chlamydomonas eustigma]
MSGKAINDLGYLLLNSLLRESDGTSNIFLSPASLFTALTLALNGAGVDTNTHSQLFHLLRGSSASADSSQFAEPTLNSGLKELIDSWSLVSSTATGSDQDGQPSPTLLMANGIFAKRGTITLMQPAYTQLMSSLFQASAREVSSPQDINDWVSTATKGKIPELLNPSQQFEAVLCNVLYFKGFWKSAFKKSLTSPRVFHAPSGDVEVPTMVGVFEKAEKITVLTFPGKYNAISLPYKGGRFSALVALPDEGVSMQDALHAFVQGDKDAHAEQIQVRVPSRTEIIMPKFKSGFSIELKDALQELGVKDAFLSGKADFSRLSEGLFVSSVIHKTVVEVDEEGTVAAAATAVAMNRCLALPEEEPLSIEFNRPFMFSIQDLTTATMMFVGVVQLP